MMDNNHIALFFLISSFVTIIAAGCIPLYGLISHIDDAWPFFVCLALAGLALFFLKISIWFSHSYAKHKYQDYNSFIESKITSFNYDYDFIFAYRCDEILKLLKTPAFQQININDLIDYFTKKSSNIKFKRWGPVTITGLMMFPLWSEFVGSYIDKGLDMIFFLLLFSVVASYILVMIHSFLRTTLLSKAIKYDELVNVLTMVKSYL